MAETEQARGIMISPVTMAVKELSWNERILIEKVNDLDTDERGCYASNQYLGDFLGVKANTMANMLSELTRKGYLIRVFFDGRNRGYRSALHSEPSLKNDSSPEPSPKNDGLMEEPSLKSDTSMEEPSQINDGCDNNLHEKVMVESEPSLKNDGSTHEPSLFNENEPSLFNEQSTRDKEENVVVGLNARVREKPPTAAVSLSVMPKETDEDYLKRKQTEYPQFDVYDVFKDFAAKCRSPQYPHLKPTRENFDKWLATEHQPLVLQPEKFVNPMTGKTLK